MNDRYQPKSEFLKAIVAEEVPLSQGVFADANLRRLIELTRDEDYSNRDWATMLLAQQEIDSDEVRTALLIAAGDEDVVIKAEALLGLAQRDPSLALPLVKQALSGEKACMAVFEAAVLIADFSLVDALRSWTEPSEDEFLDRLARDALATCERGSRET